jgi:hypothetical protein
MKKSSVDMDEEFIKNIRAAQNRRIYDVEDIQKQLE